MLITVLLLATVGGCGSNKHLNPVAKLVYQGAYPPSMNVPVTPAVAQSANFLFSVRLDGEGLSMLASDAWIIDGYTTTFTLVSDPGGHLLALPLDDHQHTRTKVSPNSPTRYLVSLVTESYLNDNASGFIGTADVATVKVHVVFHAHAVKDGRPKTIRANYVFNIGDY